MEYVPIIDDSYAHNRRREKPKMKSKNIPDLQLLIRKTVKSLIGSYVVAVAVFMQGFVQLAA